MKRFMTIIFFTFIVHSVFAMEEKHINTESIFSKLIPELQVYTIQQGIESRLNSNPDPIEAIIDAWKYVSNITSTNTFWHSKQKELINQLKDLAFEKFAPEYIEIKKEDLNEKLKNVMLKLFGAMTRKENVDNQRNEIVKLIIAGANPHTKGTLPSLMPPMFAHDKAMVKSFKINISLFNLAANANDFNLLRLLLIYGGDINFRIRSRTVLMDVANRVNGHMGAHKMADFLIKHGAKPDLKDKKGETPLRKAIGTKSVLVVQTLLNHGAQVDEDLIKLAEDQKDFFTGEMLNSLIQRMGISAQNETNDAMSQIIELLKEAKNKSDNNQ